jgi:hypothetical protein
VPGLNCPCKPKLLWDCTELGVVVPLSRREYNELPDSEEDNCVVEYDIKSFDIWDIRE